MKRYMWTIWIGAIVLLLSVSSVWLFYNNDMSPKLVHQPHKNSSVRFTMSYSGYEVSWNKPALLEVVSCGDFLLLTQETTNSGRMVDPYPGWACDKQYSYTNEEAVVGKFILQDRIAVLNIKLTPKSDDVMVVTIKPVSEMEGQLLGYALAKAVLVWAGIAVLIVIIAMFAYKGDRNETIGK